MRSYPVKENPIGSAIIEILLYKHTNTQTNIHIDILLLYYKDNVVLMYIIKNKTNRLDIHKIHRVAVFLNVKQL